MDYFITHERPELDDIAVIKVKKSINLRLYTPVCLPGRNANFAYSKATAVGFGTRDEFGNKPALLQEGTLTIKEHSACAWFWHGNFCAGGSGGSGICFGDSGGPLTVEKRQGRHILAGISSFVLDKRCKPNKPSYFADVSYYRDWIKEKTGI